MKYTLYHIKGVKWGMTERLEERLKQQGYSISDCCEFEYYDDVDTAADREKELNLKFGYPWSDAQDWRRVYKMTRASMSEKAIKNRSKAQMGHSVSDGTKLKISKTRSGQRVGEDGPGGKLTEYDVLQIRKKYKPRIYSLQKLADEYDVSKQMIRYIIIRKKWKHL